MKTGSRWRHGSHAFHFGQSELILVECHKDSGLVIVIEPLSALALGRSRRRIAQTFQRFYGAESPNDLNGILADGVIVADNFPTFDNRL